MAELVVTGTRQLEALLGRAGAAAPTMLAAAMFAEAEYIMGRSVPLVPVDTGVLRGSHVVMPPVVSGARIEVTFGYGGAASAYALSVHENPRSGRTGGITPSGSKRKHYARSGRWKYLEGPAYEAFPSSPTRMAASMRGMFR